MPVKTASGSHRSDHNLARGPWSMIRVFLGRLPAASRPPPYFNYTGGPPPHRLPATPYFNSTYFRLQGREAGTESEK